MHRGVGSPAFYLKIMFIAATHLKHLSWNLSEIRLLLLVQC